MTNDWMEEKLIIQHILRGNTSEFAYFVEKYQNMAYTISFRICNNAQNAEDVVQDAFIKAFRNLHTFRLGSKFSTWFYRIVYNTALTQIQTGFYTNECLDSTIFDTTIADTDMNVLDQIDKAQKSLMIEEAIHKLPKDYAVILTLFYLEENSIKDIERITGLSEGNVRVKLHRARKQFADILKPILNK